MNGVRYEAVLTMKDGRQMAWRDSVLRHLEEAVVWEVDTNPDLVSVSTYRIENGRRTEIDYWTPPAHHVAVPIPL